MTCEKITYYIEKGYLTELNLSEKLQVRLHKMVCRCCKNYEPDSNIVNHLLSLLKEDDQSKSLTAQEKQNLKDVLEKLEGTDL